MTAPAQPRQRPPLVDLALDETLTSRERELYVARLVADDEVDFDAAPLKDLVVNLLATVEELQRVNVGLVNENTDLRKRLRPGGDAAESLVPGLEHAYELIAEAIRKVPA